MSAGRQLHFVFAKFLWIKAFQPLLQPVIVPRLGREIDGLGVVDHVSSTRMGERVRSASAIASLGRASTATRSPLTVQVNDREESVLLEVADRQPGRRSRRGP